MGPARFALAAALVCWAAAATAEPPAPPAAPPPAAAAPSGDKPGFLDAFNRWLDESSANFKSSLKDSQSKWDNLSKENQAKWDALNKDSKAGWENLGKATKEATDALAKLPSARMIEGHERCEPAPNGSPNCVAAAETICRAKGFGSGKSLDTQSAQKCPARLWLSGRLPAEGECAVETYVTRAVCQ